jgi:3-dehydroquinate synthase
MVIPVRLGPRSYSIVVETGALATVGSRLRELAVGSRVVVVSDPSIMRLHGPAVIKGLETSGFSVTTLEVPEGEAAKTFAIATRCWDQLLAAVSTARRRSSRSAGGPSATWPGSWPPRTCAE